MTIQLPHDLESSVRSLVQGGRFASEDELIIHAVRSFLDHQHSLGLDSGGFKSDELGPAPLLGSMPGFADEFTEEERAEQALQLRLVESGLLTEVKPPIRDLTPYRNRRAIPIHGEPLSETIIRERR